MTSAARGRAVGVVVVLLLSAASLAAGRDGPGATGARGRGLAPRARPRVPRPPAHDDGAGTPTTPPRRSPPERARGPGRARAHEHEPTAEDDRRTVAQGFPAPVRGACATAATLRSAKGVRCTHGDDVDLSSAPPAARGHQRRRDQPQLGLGRVRGSTACRATAVQMLYVRRTDQGNRFESTKTKMHRLVGDHRRDHRPLGAGDRRHATGPLGDRRRLHADRPGTRGPQHREHVHGDGQHARGPQLHGAPTASTCIAAEMGNYCGLGETYADDRPHRRPTTTTATPRRCSPRCRPCGTAGSTRSPRTSCCTPSARCRTPRRTPPTTATAPTSGTSCATRTDRTRGAVLPVPEGAREPHRLQPRRLLLDQPAARQLPPHPLEHRDERLPRLRGGSRRCRSPVGVTGRPPGRPRSPGTRRPSTVGRRSRVTS